MPRRNLQAVETKKKKGCHWWPLIFTVGLIAGGLFVYFAIAKKGPFNISRNNKSIEVIEPNSSEDGTNVGGKGGTEKQEAQGVVVPRSCPDISVGSRFVMFWQSEVDGCDKIPTGVTHVVWGFSEVGFGDSTASDVLQGNKDTLKRCVKELHIVGGAGNVVNMATISNAHKFAQSVEAVIKEYNFDGVDIDDETVGSKFDPSRVIAYMKELYSRLKYNGNSYLVTFDGLAFEADSTRCKNPDLASYIRCFPTAITPYVDWVHAMVYNIDRNVTVANSIYQNAITDLFPGWLTAVGGDKSKLILGVCIEGGCAYGPGPSEQVQASWAKYSKGLGGMMVYAGSSEVKVGFPTSRAIIKILRS